MAPPATDALSQKFAEFLEKEVTDYKADDKKHGKNYYKYVVFLGGDTCNPELKEKLKTMRAELLKKNQQMTMNEEKTRTSQRYDDMLLSIHSCLAPQGIKDGTLRAVIAIWASEGPIQNAFNAITEANKADTLDWPGLENHRSGNFYVKVRAAFLGESLNRTVECFQNVNRVKQPNESWKSYADNMTVAATASNVDKAVIPFLFLRSMPSELVNNIAKIHTDFHKKELMEMADIAMAFDPQTPTQSANIAVNAMQQMQQGRPRQNFNQQPRMRPTHVHPMKLKWDTTHPTICYRCHETRHPRGTACPRANTKCNYCGNNGHFEDACFRKAYNEGKDLPTIKDRRQRDSGNQRNRSHVQTLDHDTSASYNDGNDYGYNFNNTGDHIFNNT